jgi:hypothetical protein
MKRGNQDLAKRHYDEIVDLLAIVKSALHEVCMTRELMDTNHINAEQQLPRQTDNKYGGRPTKMQHDEHGGR